MKELADFFATKGFLPHGYCINWSPELLWVYVVSDAFIGLAYYSIPVALIYFVLKREDLRFNWIFLMFSAFIFACGTTHFIDVVTIWQPMYWVDAAVKGATAAISALTAFLLWPLVPKAIALPSRRELEISNTRLGEEVAAHRQTEAAHRASEERYRLLSESLERRVADRTAELEAANRELQREIAVRERAEAQLQEANARLTAALAGEATQANELAQLHEMGSLLQTCRSESEVCAVVARVAPGLLEAGSGALFTLNDDRTVAEATSVWGTVPADEQVFKANDCWALRRGRLHPEDVAQAGIRCAPMRSAEGERHTCLPLSANGEMLGVLHLRDRAVPIPDDDRALAAMASERIALAIASLRLRETLTQLALRDPLTGLFNRRHLGEFLALEERRSRRSGRSIGLIMLDLDHFKEVNDERGHEAGDEVLRRIAELLQHHTRGGDIACRYGGEEFLLVLPGASLEASLGRAHELRASAETLQILFDDRRERRITVSLGVAAFPENGETCAAAIAAADRALFAAKRGGRNRVERATPAG